MFDPKTDPLGIGVQSRARDARFRLAAQGLASPIGPLPDPQWDGFFQAVSEAAPGKAVNFNEGPAFNDPNAVLGGLQTLRQPKPRVKK